LAVLVLGASNRLAGSSSDSSVPFCSLPLKRPTRHAPERELRLAELGIAVCWALPWVEISGDGAVEDTVGACVALAVRLEALWMVCDTISASVPLFSSNVRNACTKAAHKSNFETS
jgi:hypothetical protein